MNNERWKIMKTTKKMLNIRNEYDNKGEKKKKKKEKDGEEGCKKSKSARNRKKKRQKIDISESDSFFCVEWCCYCCCCCYDCYCHCQRQYSTVNLKFVWRSQQYRAVSFSQSVRVYIVMLRENFSPCFTHWAATCWTIICMNDVRVLVCVRTILCMCIICIEQLVASNAFYKYMYMSLHRVSYKNAFIE